MRKGDRYVINGQKVWISRIQHSDLMILLARTTPLAEVKRKSEGMSIFLVDLREAIGKGLTVQPIANMVNHETNELFFDNLEIPADSLIGEEGKGFRYILDGLNAERTLIAAECIGDGRWFIDKASHYARDRVVFGRPIGQNQGVQFPIAEAHIEVEAADLMRWRACQEYDAGLNAGASANMAKYLAAKASWEAANACLQTHGGFGFACEYDVERKFRETRPVPGGADLHQPDPVLRGRAPARTAALVLKREPPMQIDRLDHLVLTVRDIDASIDFYTRVLGMRAVTFGAGRKALAFGAQKINLHQAGGEFEPKAERPTPGSADLCFIVATPLEAVAEQLRQQAVEILEGPVQRTGAGGPILSLYLRDPDLNLIELSNPL
ncbi:acyl-CoA dehydrogenase family protein [Pseudomonas aeruginosa]|nr:acyl-CoA dehydrogenase family protein [Pseudomonas aeruginosa]